MCGWLCGCGCVCVYFRSFIHLAQLSVSWVVLGDIGWFGGTLTDRGGGSLGELWDVSEGF